MLGKRITVLLIEDNVADARLVREILEEDNSVQFKLIHVTGLKKGLDRLAEGGIDVILLDLSLPDSQGVDTFTKAHAHSPRIPIVVLTGRSDDRLATATLRGGGQDFLSKGITNLCALNQSIRHAIARKGVEESHRATELVGDAGRVDDRFLSVICEELRPPLAQLLLSVSDTLAEPTLHPKLVPSLTAIRQLVEVQGSLLDDLLIYAQLGSGAADVQPTDCRTAVDQAVANLRPLIDETHAVVDYETLPSVLSEPGQLSQLFQYLIANALRYRGFGPPHIHIAAQRQAQDWIISVRDNGIGFDAECAERIFIVFQRLHSKDAYPGAGIGLAICKRIVERRGGRIWAESEPGRGSRFFFTMPATLS